MTVMTLGFLAEEGCRPTGAGRILRNWSMKGRLLESYVQPSFQLLCSLGCLSPLRPQHVYLLYCRSVTCKLV